MILRAGKERRKGRRELGSRGSPSWPRAMWIISRMVIDGASMVKRQSRTALSPGQYVVSFMINILWYWSHVKVLARLTFRESWPSNNSHYVEYRHICSLSLCKKEYMILTDTIYSSTVLIYQSNWDSLLPFILIKCFVT